MGCLAPRRRFLATGEVCLYRIHIHASVSLAEEELHEDIVHIHDDSGSTQRNSFAVMIAMKYSFGYKLLLW